MKAKLYIVTPALLAAVMSAPAQSAMPQAKAEKLPTIYGTHTPPKGADWGCGVDKDVTVMEDGSRVCPVKPYNGSAGKTGGAQPYNPLDDLPPIPERCL